MAVLETAYQYLFIKWEVLLGTRSAHILSNDSVPLIFSAVNQRSLPDVPLRSEIFYLFAI